MGKIGFAGAPRFAELLRDLFGDDEEITPPGIIVNSDRPEWKFNARERLWTIGPTPVAANVAGVGQVELSYPQSPQNAATRMLAVILGIKVCGVNVVAGDRYQLTHLGGIAGAPAQGFALDTRFDPSPAVTGKANIRSQILNTAAGVGGDILDEVSANATGQDLFFSIVPLILHQASAFTTTERYTVYTTVVNKALRVNAWGYERVAGPEELDVL